MSNTNLHARTLFLDIGSSHAWCWMSEGVKQFCRMARDSSHKRISDPPTAISKWTHRTPKPLRFHNPTNAIGSSFPASVRKRRPPPDSKQYGIDRLRPGSSGCGGGTSLASGLIGARPAVDSSRVSNKQPVFLSDYACYTVFSPSLMFLPFRVVASKIVDAKSLP